MFELAIQYHTCEHPNRFWIDLLPSLQWNLNNVYTRPIGINPYKYLFGFKLESLTDCLTAMLQTPEDILERKFIKKHLRKDIQFAMDQTNALAKRYYDSKHRWEEFEVGDQVWLYMGTVYRPKGRANKREMPRRLGLYPIVRKISPLVYELDLLIGNRIYPVISIAYLIRYYVNDDPYNCILPSPGPVEYGSESDSTSNDNEQDSKRWELERIVDHENRRGTAWYLVRWKGYGPKEDSWKKVTAFKYAKRLVEEYHERLRRREELMEKAGRKRARPWITQERPVRRRQSHRNVLYVDRVQLFSGQLVVAEGSNELLSGGICCRN